jgi:hypothetical protein
MTRTPQMGHSNPVEGLNTDSVNFIWVDSAANRDVEYTATLDGSQIKVKSTFNIQIPDTSVTSMSGTTGIIPMYDNSLFTWIILNPARRSTVGIRFTRGTTIVPSPYTGNFWFVQTIGYQVSGTTTDGRNINVPRSGLDGCYPYFLNQDTVFDTPGAALQSNGPPVANAYVAQTLRYTGNWNMYLMFKPDTIESDWVPLKLTNWAWVGEANLVAGSSPFQWTGTQITNPMNPTGVDAMGTYPIWSQVVTDSNGCNQ